MLDIEKVMEETKNVAVLTRDGPGVHRDMCHVIKVRQLDEGQGIELKNEKGLYWVLLGRVKVK